MKIDDADVRRVFPEVDEIADPTLKRNVIEIWIEVADECAWARLEDCPKNLDHERYRPLGEHVRGVTVMALGLAETAKRLHGTDYDRDVLLASCLLHDVSKLVETEPDPDGEPSGGAALPGRKSPLGKKIQHAAYATHKAFARNLPLAVSHLILTHTHASNMRSTSLEGCYLFYADYADSDAAITRVGGKTFAERWHL